MNPKKIIVINLGSTSTKLAYYEDDRCLVKENLSHDSDELKKCPTINSQYELRKAAVLDFMREHGIKLDELDSVTVRGGQTEPIVGGTYRINEAMVEQTQSGRYGNHVCNLGCRIAFDLCRESDHAVPLTTDTPTTDEMEPVARYTGLKEISRYSCVQALNIKAMSRYYAEQNGKKLEDVNVVTVMLGGGIGVVAIRNGKMVDAPDALEGEGPFSNNRCCTVPIGKLVKLCYSGKYTLEEMMRHINGEAGLMAYLGTTDLRAIMKRIEEGDTHAAEIIDAMCYQTSKEIGAMSTVLKGKVDAILLIGGMANVEYIVNAIKDSVGFIAPVVVLPGEREMESLGINSYEALTGKKPILEFVPREA